MWWVFNKSIDEVVAELLGRLAIADEVLKGGIEGSVRIGNLLVARGVPWSIRLVPARGRTLGNRRRKRFPPAELF